ncbi:MAG: LamG domain-containing protein [Thermoguttaceae bacterium]
MKSRVILSAWCLVALLAASPAAGYDYGLCFGNGGRIRPPPLVTPTGLQQLTVELRFKALALPPWELPLLSQTADDETAVDKGLFHMDLTSRGQVAFSLRGTKGLPETVTSKTACVVERWHHAAATWDGAELKLYVDGKAAGGRKLADFTLPASASIPLVIGPAAAKRGRVQADFHGFLGEVAVWSTARGADAVAQDAARSPAGNEAGLAAYYCFREAGPVVAVRDKVSGGDGKIPPAMATTGWCRTPMWDDPQPGRAYLHLFAYNISAPPTKSARRAAVRSRPAAAAKSASAAPKGREEMAEESPPLKGPMRQILVCNAKTQQIGILWQANPSGAIYITWVDAELTSHETIKLKSMPDGVLAAGTADPAGNVYYFEVQRGPTDPPPKVPLRAMIYAAAPDGQALGERKFDTTTAKGGFNIRSYEGAGSVGSMVYQNGMLGVILPRIIDSGHQVASVYVFSARDPSTFKDLGTASSHSFGNYVVPESRGGFLGVDLGDNYPRGVHLHRFGPTGMASHIVFTYKTVHLPFPRKEGSAVYKEISTSGKTYYTWSNDNGVYTELGGVVEGQASYSVIFATDRSPDGRVLDNRRAVEGHNDEPRDLAMLRIIKEFDKVRGGTEVSDLLIAGGLPRGSQSESGGFYDFGGQRVPQRVTGVIWLTSFKPGGGAHAPQPLRLRDGSILILWEKTGPHGIAVCGTRIAESGDVLGQSVCPMLDWHFNRGDRAIELGDRIFLLATDKPSGETRLFFVYDVPPVAVRPGKPLPGPPRRGR